MLVIRLARVGKKKQPEYRMVVADRRRAVTGRFIDVVGHYNPLTDPATIKVDMDKIKEWLAKGAQPSGTVRSLLDHAEKGKEITNKPKNRKKSVTKAPAPEAEAAEVAVESAEAVPAETPEKVAEETPTEAPAEEATEQPGSTKEEVSESPQAEAPAEEGGE
jgi:small subunit ribosomal protein S16